ncbi:hypothetical protein ACRS6B_28515 [Nocardia asteroides]
MIDPSTGGPTPGGEIAQIAQDEGNQCVVARVVRGFTGLLIARIRKIEVTKIELHPPRQLRELAVECQQSRPQVGVRVPQQGGGDRLLGGDHRKNCMRAIEVVLRARNRQCRFDVTDGGVVHSVGMDKYFTDSTLLVWIQTRQDRRDGR